MVLGDAQKGTEYTRLAVPVVPGNPEHLAFSDHLYGLNPLNQHSSRLDGPRPLHRPQPPLHVSMIRFDAIVAVLTTSMTAGGTDLTLVWVDRIFASDANQRVRQA